MKKSLIALVTLGAITGVAQAQSNVTIGGVVQADLKNYSVGNSSRVTEHEWRIDDDYTSRFWLSGKEDLGSGVSALFYLENRLNTDVGAAGDTNGLTNGDSYVGLASGPLGQLTAGRHTMLWGEGLIVEYGSNGRPALPTSMYATNSILSFIGSTGLNTSRIDNSILYKSPTFSGFSGSLGYSTSGNNGNEGTIPAGGAVGNYSDGYRFYIKGNYTNGPIYVNLAFWKAQTEGRPIAITPANADQREVRLSASYQFENGFKAGLQFDRAQLDNVGRTAAGVGGTDQSRNAWEIPVNYTFGPHTILASYTRANDFSGISNTGAKMWVLGWDMTLSKRTNVGLFYSHLSNDGLGTYQPYKSGTSQNGSVLLAGESASIWALGIKHMF